MSSIPNPATTDWVPVWGGFDLRYNGSWVAGTYTDGDIVIYNGVPYVAVRTTTAIPAPWPGALSAVTYGTTLPASPVDGQEAILVDSVTNPSYQWRFRYNAGSSSAYKWEYIGGTPWFATAYAGTWQQFSGSSNWVAAQPQLNAPRAGDYWISWSAQFQVLPGGATLVQIGGGVSGNTGLVQALNPTQSGSTMMTAMFDQRVSSIAQGATMQPYVWASANTATLANLACRINPARVS